MIRAACLSLLLLPGLASARHAAEPWTFDAGTDAIRASSCDGNGDPFTSVVASIDVIDPGLLSLPDGVDFIGGWAIDADGVGGLSGLATLPDGNMLSVSDNGHWVKLGLTDGAPDGQIDRAPMRLAKPRVLPGKLNADAEGLDVRDGIALVGFERDFRVLGFDIGACGAAARGVLVSRPPERYGRRKVRANAGPEALMLRADGTVVIGYEQPRDGRIVTATLLSDGTAHFDTEGDTLEEGFRLVGLDTAALPNGTEVTATLLRTYDRDQGNRNIVSFAGASIPNIRLAPPALVDNFEAVALVPHGGGLRLWLLSDDNFSDRQRTLLYAFEVALP